MNERSLERNGFCLLKKAVTESTVERLLSVCRVTFEGDSDGVRARSSRGHVFAARNLIDSIPEVTEENGPLRVIPGSHASSTSEGDGLDAAVDVHAKAGDVLAMRPLISHSSSASKPGTQRHRRILHLEFAASAKLPDEMQWHHFVATRSLPLQNQP